VVVNRHAPAELWRNASADAGRWVQIRLSQPGFNHDAIGAWVEIRRGGHVMRREVTAGGGHASGQRGWIHFGLGEAAEAELRVIWPDGADGEWERLEAGRFYRVERGKPAASWTPPNGL